VPPREVLAVCTKSGRKKPTFCTNWQVDNHLLISHTSSIVRRQPQRICGGRLGLMLTITVLPLWASRTALSADSMRPREVAPIDGIELAVGSARG
jgi:hypothetical protein